MDKIINQISQIRCQKCTGSGFLKYEKELCKTCHGKKCVSCKSSGFEKMPWDLCYNCQGDGFFIKKII